MIDCDDVFEMFVYMFMIAENATHYEAGNLTAVEAADNSVELFYMLVGFFTINYNISSVYIVVITSFRI